MRRRRILLGGRIAALCSHPPSRILKLTRFLRPESEAEVAPRGSRVSSPVLSLSSLLHIVRAGRRLIKIKWREKERGKRGGVVGGGGGEIETSGRVIAVVNESREKIHKLKIPRSFASVEKFGNFFFSSLVDEGIEEGISRPSSTSMDGWMDIINSRRWLITPNRRNERFRNAERRTVTMTFEPSSPLRGTRSEKWGKEKKKKTRSTHPSNPFLRDT